MIEGSFGSAVAAVDAVTGACYAKHEVIGLSSNEFLREVLRGAQVRPAGPRSTGPVGPLSNGDTQLQVSDFQ